jgi:hypothetical protein
VLPADASACGRIACKSRQREFLSGTANNGRSDVAQIAFGVELEVHFGQKPFLLAVSGARVSSCGAVLRGIQASFGKAEIAQWSARVNV